MTYDQTVTLTTLISAAQGVSFAEGSKTKVWHSLLEDLDFAVAHLALKKLLRTEKYNITPAHIREACVEITEPQADVLAAWKTLIGIITGFGRYKHSEAIAYAKTKDPITYQIIDQIGYINLCNSNPEFLRPEFERLYRDAVKTSTQDKMLSDKVKLGINAFRQALEQKYLSSLALEDAGYGV